MSSMVYTGDQALVQLYTVIKVTIFDPIDLTSFDCIEMKLLDLAHRDMAMITNACNMSELHMKTVLT